ncbi:hypothetical protein D3C80_1686740 [compost metagenome]
MLPAVSSRRYWVIARSVVPPPISTEAIRSVFPGSAESGRAMALKNASAWPAKLTWISLYR